MDNTKASAIKAVLLDVDGVLTDAGIPYLADESHGRVFSARDGALLCLAIRCGLRIGLCSGRGGPAVARRARELGLDPVMLEVEDKVDAIGSWAAAAGLEWEDICYCGDDLPDLGPLMRCGWSVSVADAHPVVRRRVDWVCSRRGGCGAVAELMETILRIQNRWHEALLLIDGAHG